MLMLNFTTTIFQNEIILTSTPQIEICDNIHCSPENVFGSDDVKASLPPPPLRSQHWLLLLIC